MNLRAALLLVALVLVAHLPALGAGFLWDDDTFLTANPLIHAPDGLARFWFSTEAPDYFPLTSSMLWIEWRLWGADPAGYHAVNVALHVAAVLLLWRVLSRLGVPGAWLGAALFGVHPVTVESVAWITERKNTLPAALALASMLQILRSGESGSRAAGIGAFGLFVAALLAKTSVVVLPPILLVLAWWRNGRVTRDDLRRTAPYFAAALLLGAVTLFFQSQRAIGDAAVRDDGALSRLALAGRAVWFYLGQAVWPVDLCFVYPRWETGAFTVRAFLPLVALVLWFGVAWRLRARGVVAAAACFVIALLPVLGFADIYFMRFSLVADHWQHLALPAVTAVLAAGAMRLPRSAPRATAGVALAALGLLTFQRSRVFESSESLFRDTIRRNPGAWLAHLELGVSALGKGDLPEAARRFGRAVELRPESARAHFDLGLVRERQGDPAAAESSYRAAIAARPDFPDAHDHLAITLFAQGRAAAAEASFREAIRLAPHHANAHANLAAALVRLGRLEEAAVACREALRLDPSHANAAENLRRIEASQAQRR